MPQIKSKENKDSVDILVYTVTSDNGWGAVAVHQRLRSMAWSARGVFSKDTLEPVRHQMSLIGALRRLLRPAPGLPPAKKMNAIVQHSHATGEMLGGFFDSYSDGALESGDEAWAVDRDVSSVPESLTEVDSETSSGSESGPDCIASKLVTLLSKEFHKITICACDPDDTFWPEAQEEAVRIASSVKIKDKHKFGYYPNLCATATVLVKDSKARNSAYKQTHITHDLMAAGRSGVSIIDSSFAQSLCPGVLDHLVDPGDLSVLGGKGNMNILGIYPGSLEVQLKENENITLEGSHLQKLEGVLVVHQFHVPLFVSLDLEQTGLDRYCVDMGIDTFQASKFPPPYRNHKWWKSAEFAL